MPVKYLSQEWIDAYNDALAGDAVRGALKGKNATIQMVISDAPRDGEIRYGLRIEDGGAAAGLGDLDGPDVTIRQTYETSAQVNRGDLDGHARGRSPTMASVRRDLLDRVRVLQPVRAPGS